MLNIGSLFIYVYFFYIDPPTVVPFLHQNIIEGVNFTVTCLAIPGNPNDTTFFWTMEDDSLFRGNGTTLHLPNLKRTSSGIYRCTAENLYGNGEKGTHSQSMILNVLCKCFVYIYGIY